MGQLTDLPPDPAAEARACRQLWCDVMMVALRETARDPADAWLGSRDYFIVAALAGIDTDAARDVAEAIRAGRLTLRL